MSVCSNLRGWARHHERIADIFSFMAVVLLFGSLWAGLQYHAEIVEWAQASVVLRVPVVAAGVLLDVFLIFAFLNIGAVRYTEDGEEESCFGTFRGRRTGAGSIGSAFFAWIDHMEHVNKKHR